MRLVSFQTETGSRVAGVRDGHLVDLNRTDWRVPASMKDLLAQGDFGLQRAAEVLARGETFPADSVKLLAPVPDPQKVICIGLNYADHARESGVDLPREPVVFNKFPTAVIGPGDPVVLPRLSEQVDYEAELVVVIGHGGRNIPRDRAYEHVAGYTCGHDVSARDWQLGKSGGQWLLGKTFDTFAPFGPELVTRDEVPDPGNLGIRLRLNGELVQDSSTRELIFGIDELISYISSVCTLVPGDVIFTGTPPGVGFARKPPLLLKPGDVAQVEIDGIGVLENRMIGEA